MIEFEHRSDRNEWTARPRTRNGMEMLAPVFDMLSGRTRVEAGDRRTIDVRTGRALSDPRSPCTQ